MTIPSVLVGMLTLSTLFAPASDDEAPSRFVAMGTVTSKFDAALTVRPAVGDFVTVALTDRTRFVKDGREARASDLAVGHSVRVLLTINAQGRAEAVRVTVQEEPGKKP